MNTTFEYYIRERVVSDSFMGIGPLLLAALEMEKIG